MDKTEVINKALKFSKKTQHYLRFNRVVLFGSYINGKPREDSDIDIASFVNGLSDDIDYFNLLITLNKLAGKIDSRIEPHIFTNDSESGFSEMIQLNGEEIILVN